VPLATDSGRIPAGAEAIHLAAGYLIAMHMKIYLPIERNQL